MRSGLTVSTNTIMKLFRWRNATVTRILERLSSHDWLWLFLILLLVANLVAGFVVIVLQSEFRAFILAVGAFSLAYALHLLSVSAALCSAQIRVKEQSKFQQLRDLEYKIVTYGMCVLIGGSLIVLSASFSAFNLGFAIWVYGAGAAFQLYGVLRYVLCERRWADKAWRIEHGTDDKSIDDHA